MLHRLFSVRRRQVSLLRASLLSIALFDEIVSGFLVIGLPLVRDQLQLSYTQIGLLFTAIAVSGMVLEPIISLLSDRGSKRYWILGGLLAYAISFVVAGSAQSFILLLFAFILIGPAGGAAVGLSEVALVDLAPTNGTQVMARWTLMGSIGDFLAPLTVTALVSVHVGWTGLCWLATLIWLGTALVLWLQHFPDSTNTIGEETKSIKLLLTGLREALRDPTLLRLAVLSVIPAMVDEVFLGFTALYLHDILHASQAAIGIIIAIHTIGAMLGLFALEHLFLKQITPRRLLLWLSLLVLLAMTGFLTIRSLLFATFALFFIGFGAAGWYPIVNGQAYSRLPGRTGTVLAIINVFGTLEVALTAVVSILAGHFGVLASLNFLGLAPVFVLLLLIGYKEQ